MTRYEAKNKNILFESYNLTNKKTDIAKYHYANYNNYQYLTDF